MGAAFGVLSAAVINATVGKAPCCFGAGGASVARTESMSPTSGVSETGDCADGAVNFAASEIAAGLVSRTSAPIGSVSKGRAGWREHWFCDAGASEAGRA